MHIVFLLFIFAWYIALNQALINENIIMKRTVASVLAGLVALCYFPLYSQESEVTINYEGKDITSLKHAWTAQWITHPTASTLDYNVFLYRNTFDLSEVPDSCVVHLSADNRYRFYVNGEIVSMGPARGDIDHWRYESVDISSFLKTGKNVLAAEVINFGEFRHAAQPTFQTAFILQGPKEGFPNIHTGAKSNWKVSHNRAFDFIPFVSDSVGGYYAAGPGDKLDMSLYPYGWNELDYDDTTWKSPRPATVEFAVGRGFLFGSTWYLVPREIPFMEEVKTRFQAYLPSHSTMDPTDMIAGKKALEIAPNKKVTLLLDHKIHTIGYPELHIDGGKGAKIKITYAEALFYKDSKERTAHKGWTKGHRNEFADKEIRGIYDIIMPSGEAFVYKPMAMRTFRFVQLDIETSDEPLKINDYYNVFTAYPFEEKASFRSDDASLNKIWEVSWRTLRNSSTEIFLDPYYEQLQYVGDARIEALISIYVSGDDRLMRKAIKSFDASRLPNGLTQSRFPSYIVQVIPTYSLLWVDMMHDYYMYRDDPLFLEQFLPGMETVLNWFERKIDDTGMLANLNWWNFTDWTSGFQNGIPPGADDGHSANVSMQYVLALLNAADIFSHFGEEEKALHYTQLAYSVADSVLMHCYDEEKGLIAERPEKDVFSQHTNIFAVLAGVYQGDEAKRIMEEVLNDEELIPVSIYFRFYLTAALEKAGLADKYVSMLTPWTYMLSQGMTTFGETDKNPRSDCHAWSASPCFNYLHTIAGIRPSKPGFEEVIVQPNLGYLKEVEATFPHPRGMIYLKLKKKGDRLKGSITLPDSLTGTYWYNGKHIHLKTGKNTIK